MNFILKIFVFIGFIIVSPIILISLMLIWFEDGSPVIFAQERLGINKNRFRIYKIRTMYKTAPNLGTHEVGTMHYLIAGSFLRKIKIDELPQLLNYLKGEIVLVGPRPGLPTQEKLKKYREKYNIFDIKPGITGLSQILGYDMSNPEVLAKVDKLYINNKSIKLDLYIFLATFIKSLRSKIFLKFKDEIELTINKEL
jgi:lipopolysaccharide/colanic/teichoic acid biosynthesis glycosyltransferase